MPSTGSPQESPGIAAPRRFVDMSAATGIAYEIGYRGLEPGGQVPTIATGGVAAGDYDADGDIDLFITRGDVGPNLLYRNAGDFRFDEVARAAGVAFTASEAENYRHSGPIFADIDGDADLDLFIGGLFDDPSLVFANNGDGTFTDVTQGSGIDGMHARHNISAAFGDYDLDGDLDLFVAHWGTPRDANEPGDTEHLWRNDSADGRIRFTSVSEQARISPTILNLPDPLTIAPIGDYSFTPSFARINDDLYPDILSVADYNYTQFFLNNGDGTFTNATDVEVIIDYNGMGSALGDYDNDGDLDWFVSAITTLENDPDPVPNLVGNRLYGNVGGLFEDVTREAGVADGAWGWGACFIDFENDGDLDIYHTNGWPGLYFNDVSRAFESDGSGHFEDRADELGLDDTQQGRGVVCADFDDDGDVDIFQLHRGSPVAATMWRNDSTANNYLRVKLSGRPPNTEASGARIYATIGQRSQMREIIIGNNFVSQNPTIQIFGLGTATLVDELRVEWPNGAETILVAVGAGQTVVIDQPDI